MAQKNRTLQCKNCRTWGQKSSTIVGRYLCLFPLTQITLMAQTFCNKNLFMTLIILGAV